MEHESVEYWREKLSIEIGMSKIEALDRFIDWRSGKKTCFRCEGEKYVGYCPVRLICKQAEEREVINAGRNDKRRRVNQNPQFKALRTEIFEARQRAALR